MKCFNLYVAMVSMGAFGAGGRRRAVFFWIDVIRMMVFV
jgi:hypothetical protein